MVNKMMDLKGDRCMNRRVVAELILSENQQLFGLLIPSVY